MSDVAKWGDLIAEAISGVYGDRPTDPTEPFNLCHEAWDQYDELRAERDRLREALTKAEAIIVDLSQRLAGKTVSTPLAKEAGK